MAFQRRTIGELSALVREPAGGSSGVAVVIGLHGRESTPMAIAPVAEQLGDYVHVLPQGPLAFGTGHAWYVRGEEAPAQALKSAEFLLALIAEVRSAFGTGPEQMVVWGFSQGGRLSLEIGLRSTSPLAAAVSVGGKLGESTLADPSTMRRARGRDFFLLHGVRDTVVPAELSRSAYAALNHFGAHVELAELPMAHEMSPVAIGAMRGYIASVLGASGRPAQA